MNHIRRSLLVMAMALSAAAFATSAAAQVRPAPTPDFALRVVKSYVETLRAQKGAGRPGLFVVGGVSSLYNAEGKRLIDTRPDLPAGMAGEVRSAVDSLDYLRTVDDLPQFVNKRYTVGY